MMRRSGVSPARFVSYTAREMPRRSASGQRPARQPWKLAAALRMASAVIRGWPDEPDSPLHAGAAPDADAGGVRVPVVVPAELNSERRSKPWPSTGAVEATAKAVVATAAMPRR